MVRCASHPRPVLAARPNVRRCTRCASSYHCPACPATPVAVLSSRHHRDGSRSPNPSAHSVHLSTRESTEAKKIRRGFFISSTRTYRLEQLDHVDGLVAILSLLRNAGHLDHLAQILDKLVLMLVDVRKDAIAYLARKFHLMAMQISSVGRGGGGGDFLPSIVVVAVVWFPLKSYF